MTRSGWVAIVLGATFTALGWIARWPSLVVIGIGAIALVAGALAYTIRRPRVQIDREIQPRRVQKGSMAIAFLHLKNVSRHTSPAMTANQPYGESVVRAKIPRLRPGEPGMTTYRLPTSRRGVFTIGPLELTRSDPFGFARITQRHSGADELWVHPLVLPLHPLPSGVTRHLEGPTADTAPQGDITFHRLREYEVGDDLRMIHWKSTARVGKLMVRHNVDTSQPYTVVVFDTRPECYSPESFELAVDAAASAIVAASAGQAPVQLRTTNGDTVGDVRRPNPQALLDHLTLVTPNEIGSMHNVLSRLRHERGGTALVVVGGVFDEQQLAQIATLRARFQRLVAVSVTPKPATVPSWPGVDIVHGSDAEALTLSWNIGVRA